MNRQQRERLKRVEKAQTLYRGCLLMVGSDDIDSAYYRTQVCHYFEAAEPDAPGYASAKFARSYVRWLKQANRRREIEDGKQVSET